MSLMAVAVFSVLLACFVLLITPGASFAASSEDRIHVMAIPGGDAIVVESNGMFGMVDSGEDDDYPTGEDPKYPRRSGMTIGAGTQDEVISYLESLGVNEENFVFYIGTHAHSDHVGSADEIIRLFKPKRVYTPVYDDSFITSSSKLWDNQYVYDRMLAAAKEVGAEIIQAPSAAQASFSFGDFRVSIINLMNVDSKFRVSDANDYSWGVKLEASGLTAFLGGDINNVIGSETKLAKTLGHIDFLKMAHHGLSGSNTSAFIKAISPTIAVQTQYSSQMSSESYDAMEACDTWMLSVEDANKAGVKAFVASFTDGNLTMNVKNTKVKYVRSSKSPHLTATQGGLPYVQSGWARVDGKWYLFQDSAFATEGSWVKSGGVWYYLGPDGVMQTGWLKDGGKWYYLDPENGRMVSKDVLMVDGAPYVFSSSGALCQSDWAYIGGGWYYGNPSGILKTGWLLAGGVWYWLNPQDDGRMASNCTLRIEGTTYAFLPSGAMSAGWALIDSDWYLSSSSGSVRKGWAKDGSWYYLDPADNGKMTSNCIMAIDGVRYAFDKSGAMASSSWANAAGGWYYADGSGSVRTSWLNSGAWYWLDPQNGGRMVSSCILQIDENLYAFKSSGAMYASCWFKDVEGWHYATSSGALCRLWQRIGGSWYYFDQNGLMVTGEVTIGGKKYKFDESGALAQPLLR